MPYLAGLEVAGDEDAWQAAGFNVHDGALRTGHLRIEIGVGDRGIKDWHLTSEPPAVEPDAHPNGTTLLDHLVIFTDDVARSVASYGELGFDVRRTREHSNGTSQTFFRAGEVILELVGPIPDVHGERFWGLAFTVEDIDATAALLAGRTGAVKDAVQPGRRIVTLHHKACGLTMPIAFMSPESH
jgi:hypothetical protein